RRRPSRGEFENETFPESRLRISTPAVARHHFPASGVPPVVEGVERIDVPPRSPAPPTSFAAISATCLPWKRAPSSSFSLGIRSPLPPAIVVAPYGEPPVISSSRVCP